MRNYRVESGQVPPCGRPGVAGFVVIQIGPRKYTVVYDYGDSGGSGYRSGCWCPDRAGGWGTGPTPAQAWHHTAHPIYYRSRRAAQDSIDDGVA